MALAAIGMLVVIAGVFLGLGLWQVRRRRLVVLTNKLLTTVLGAVYLPLCSLLMFMLLAGPARGTMSAAAFLVFNTSVTMLLTSVTQLTGAFVSAVGALPLFEEIRPVLEATPEVRSGSTRPGPLSGAIEARRLPFRYADDGPLVLDDVSFEAAVHRFRAGRHPRHRAVHAGGGDGGGRAGRRPQGTATPRRCRAASRPLFTGPGAVVPLR